MVFTNYTCMKWTGIVNILNTQAEHSDHEPEVISPPSVSVVSQASLCESLTCETTGGREVDVRWGGIDIQIMY